MTITLTGTLEAEIPISPAIVIGTGPWRWSRSCRNKLALADALMAIGDWRQVINATEHVTRLLSAGHAAAWNDAVQRRPPHLGGPVPAEVDDVPNRGYRRSDSAWPKSIRAANSEGQGFSQWQRMASSCENHA